ncbi:hypothetical protein PCANC_12057 [Puccinia coronata f. sp. avenae]|uniref:Uncharacterized protein n=1 Tax=Puccinia coronata f. sp. avenae TaxID=200324 RepID=A0A2N5T3L9_9BASI|nr:hypothetical protein PCANC_12057 [Puccinia coronata f. sp. avenae]PLW44828.1 hypothetical protein PCASD_07133 [Puccinia coronata f. sp. avenae]
MSNVNRPNALLALSSTQQRRGLTAEHKRSNATLTLTHPKQRSATSYDPSRLPVQSPTFAPSTLTHMRHLHKRLTCGVSGSGGKLTTKYDTHAAQRGASSTLTKLYHYS